MDSTRSGVSAAVAAFSLWGILPIFWKLFQFLPPQSIVAQRTIWSLLMLTAMLFWKGEGNRLWTSLKSPRAVGWHFLSGILLASNWLLYVWATLNGHMVDAALGYYLNPFFNMLFGALWFGETHSRWQLAAILVALAGVSIQLPAAGHFPWIAVLLAATFALYAAIRKKASLGTLVGLTLETSLLAPMALAWLVLGTSGPVEAFGQTGSHALLVISTGLVTALPLLLFSHATRTLRLTTLGILQFMNPTLQFFIGWWMYGEHLSMARLFSFTFIWIAIGIYAWDALTHLETKSVKP